MSSKKVNKSELFSRIDALRQFAGISQAAIAKLTGTSKAFYSEMKAGRTGPSIDFIAGLFKLFKNLNASWLFFGEGEMFLQNESGNYLRDSVEEYGQNKDKPIDLLYKRLSQCSKDDQLAITSIIDGLLQLINK